MRRYLVWIVAGLLWVSPAVAVNVKEFCEYGVGFGQISATAGLWQQTWGQGGWDWYDCPARPNVQFLGENVTGELVTTAQVFQVPGPGNDFILKANVFGTLTLTAHDPENPDKVVGEIKADIVTAVFVADCNASRAMVTDDTIIIRLGERLELEEPFIPVDPPLFKVTSTSGKFKSIKAVGYWEHHISGTITLARLPGQDLQTNILMALGNPALILGAREEIVLTGSYVRTSPNQDTPEAVDSASRESGEMR